MPPKVRRTLGEITEFLDRNSIQYRTESDNPDSRYILKRDITNIFPRRYIIDNFSNSDSHLSLNTCDPYYPDEVSPYQKGFCTIVGFGIGKDKDQLENQLDSLFYDLRCEFLNLLNFKHTNFLLNYVKCLTREMDRYRRGLELKK